MTVLTRLAALATGSRLFVTQGARVASQGGLTGLKSLAKDAFTPALARTPNPQAVEKAASSFATLASGTIKRLTGGCAIPVK